LSSLMRLQTPQTTLTLTVEILVTRTLAVAKHLVTNPNL
jgi:hypothetical protein